MIGLNSFVDEVMNQLKPFLPDDGIVHFDLQVKEVLDGGKVYIVADTIGNNQHVVFDVPVGLHDIDF